MKKKFFGSLIALLTVIGMMPVFVMGAGGGVGGGIGGEVIVVPPPNSPPDIWMDPATREILDGSGIPITRGSNYAFSGEQIIWDVIVYDPDGISDINQVHIVIGPFVDFEDERIAFCQTNGRMDDPIEPIDGMAMSFDLLTMEWYTCTFEVAGDMFGEYGIVAEVEDNAGNTAQFDEDSYFYLNPVISITIENDPIQFLDVSPGERVYSNTILIRNTADPETGVILDIEISGSDLYDPSNDGLKAQCPINNALELSNFAYYATNAEWDTYMSGQTIDPEGYDGIPLEGVDLRQRLIYDPFAPPDWPGLVIGSDAVITFRLDVPTPCEGNFVIGGDPDRPNEFIYFWAEAI